MFSVGNELLICLFLLQIIPRVRVLQGNRTNSRVYIYIYVYICTYISQWCSKAIYVTKFIVGIGSCDYGGWQVPRSTGWVSKPETSQWWSYSWVASDPEEVIINLISNYHSNWKVWKSYCYPTWKLRFGKVKSLAIKYNFNPLLTSIVNSLVV